MIQNEIDEILYKKYIEPTKKKRKCYAGIEIEMPIVNLDRKPVEEKKAIQVAEAFRKQFGFQVAGRDAEGNAYLIEDKKTGDTLSFDCSYSNLELSMGKAENLFLIKERFETYYQFLNERFAKFHYTLTGMGINPYYDINHNQPIPNERYRMLYHYLHSYPKHKGQTEKVFHNRPDFGTFTSASQVQLDVTYDNLLTVLNTFGALEPYKVLLFANSYFPESPNYLCARNMLWEHSMQGYNPHNIGMFDQELKSVDDLLAYIKTTSIYCTMRDGKYIDFTPIPVQSYLNMEQVTGEYYENGAYHTITFRPSIDDVEYLRTFKFEDLTFRGTIEFRSACCQPIRESMTLAAFHIGLMNQLEELETLLKNDHVIYHKGYTATELQKFFSKRELPDFIEKDAVRRQLLAILTLAEQGMRKRGWGEEVLLIPLIERAEKLTNPAKRLVSGLESGKTLEYYIEEYAAI